MGLLLAPRSGRETRMALCDTITDFKDFLEDMFNRKGGMTENKIVQFVEQELEDVDIVIKDKVLRILQDISNKL